MNLLGILRIDNFCYKLQFEQISRSGIPTATYPQMKQGKGELSKLLKIISRYSGMKEKEDNIHTCSEQ